MCEAAPPQMKVGTTPPLSPSWAARRQPIPEEMHRAADSTDDMPWMHVPAQCTSLPSTQSNMMAVLLPWVTPTGRVRHTIDRARAKCGQAI